MTTATKDRKDALDIEAFETMLAGASFAAFMENVTAELARALSTCETSDDPNVLYRAQGAAHALRAVRRMPETMLKAMQAGTWKPPQLASLR